MQRKTTSGTRLLQLAAIAICGGLAYATEHVTRHAYDSLGVVLALGLLLICGTLAGGLLEALRIPHLTAYLAVGVIAGPYAIRLIDRQTVDSLQTVNTLALALIAFAGGAELRIADVRRSLRSLSAAAFTQCILVFVGGAIIFAAVSPLVSFIRGASIAMIVGVSLLWGVLSITRSPAATLAILSQTRARGPLTNFSLSFVMLSDVLVIVIATTVIALVKPMLDPSTTLSLDVFNHLGHEIIGSVSLGTTLGLLMVLYLRLVNKQIPIVLVGLGFGFTEVVNYVRLDPLLTFLVAGFLIQNLSNQGEKLLHAIEDMGAVVYVVFFATAGAGLDVPLLRRLWPVALVLFLGRLLLTVGVNRISCRIAKDPPVLQRWGWTGLVSQAGVVLGLAISIARAFPSFGPAFRALAIATVALNQLIGPILFKLALDATGESARDPEPSRSMRPPAPA
ncbi:MAG TPA: cation:proton antiporter [Polyangiaceae bacterium]|jgi:Kef-type K+ transport system membrane component KefB